MTIPDLADAIGMVLAIRADAAVRGTRADGAPCLVGERVILRADQW
jgi:hypothetical protein